VKKEEISCRAHASSIRRSPSRHVCAIRGKGERTQRQSTKKNLGVSGAGKRDRQEKGEGERGREREETKKLKRGLKAFLFNETRLNRTPLSLHRDSRMYVANFATFLNPDKLIAHV